MNLIIDEGNTRIKLAIYKNSQLVDIKVSDVESFQDSLYKLLKTHTISAVIASSVTDNIKNILDKINVKYKCVLSNTTPLPFKNNYNTPLTLGVDRLALVTAAYYQYPNENALVIDAGTCITYDFIDSKGVYQGGAISPGLQMRFKSLNLLTKKLPEITSEGCHTALTGKSTKESILSGVLNGIVFELQGVVATYEEKYENIRIILTGGDANCLCKQLKNSIFVDPNFLLEGLNQALTYQIKHEAKHK